jgi:hypothetical protein
VRRRALAAALVCCALGWGWQWLTVHYNYGGNWTALFCHGSQYPLPAALAGEHIYVFANSGGYDGQSYHYMAHDPLGRGEIGRAVPDPALRFPRILVPAMAYLLALGRAEWVDAAYSFCELLFLGLGAYWLAGLLERRGISAWFAIGYVAVPVVIVSLDRMLVDVAVTSLALGFACYVERDGWELWMVMAAAALCRDTGMVLFAAYALRLAWQRRFARIAVLATSLIPAVAWTLWVRAAIPGAAALGVSHLYPFYGMAQAILHPRHYSFSPVLVAAIVGLWWVQFAGIVLGIVLAFRRGIGLDALGNACFLWAAFAILLPPGVYDDPFAGARVLGPMLLYLGLRGQWVPMLMVSPRVWLELGAQARRIERGLMG